MYSYEFAEKRHEYSGSGDRTRLEADSPNTAALDHAIDYQYDAMGRTVSITSGGNRTTYEYESGCPVCGSRSLPVRIAYPNGLEARYEYEGGYRLRLLRNMRTRDQVNLSFFEYGYDTVDNRVSIRDANGTHKYEYDKLYRLTRQDAGNYNDHVYSYDPAGNRLTWDEEHHPSRAYSYLPGNRLEKVLLSDTTKVEYTWDGAGNLMTRKEKPSNYQTSFTFDAENRMTQVVLSSGSTFTYGYDSSGQRIYRNLDGAITWFVFDGLSTVMELDGAKKPTATFIPGISRTRLDLPESLPEYYLHDGLGSVAQITDHLGNLIQEYRYNPFGDLQDGVTDKLNKYRFVGLAHEDSLGLIYMNARWYEPQTGRFVGRDPLRGAITETQSLNLYPYVENNPLDKTDVSGLNGDPDKSDCPESCKGSQDFDECMKDCMGRKGEQQRRAEEITEPPLPFGPATGRAPPAANTAPNINARAGETSSNKASSEPAKHGTRASKPQKGAEGQTSKSSPPTEERRLWGASGNPVQLV